MTWKPRSGIKLYLYSSFKLATRWTWVIKATYWQLKSEKNKPFLFFCICLVLAAVQFGLVRKFSSPRGFDANVFLYIYSVAQSRLTNFMLSYGEQCKRALRHSVCMYIYIYIKIRCRFRLYVSKKHRNI